VSPYCDLMEPLPSLDRPHLRTISFLSPKLTTLMDWSNWTKTNQLIKSSAHKRHTPAWTNAQYATECSKGIFLPKWGQIDYNKRLVSHESPCSVLEWNLWCVLPLRRTCGHYEETNEKPSIWAGANWKWSAAPQMEMCPKIQVYSSNLHPIPSW
jgi:hypothetical protein